jgi:hypothetical protein
MVARSSNVRLYVTGAGLTVLAVLLVFLLRSASGPALRPVVGAAPVDFDVPVAGLDRSP